MEYNGVRVECMEGWKGLYEPLIDLCELRGIMVKQVKEKFGTLSFYVDKRGLDAIIEAAEVHSQYICEICGESGHKLVSKTGSRTSNWIKSLCAPCREARDLKREQYAAEFDRKWTINGT